MAKSIRSKIKRKHRAEFRRTIGTEAHNKHMAIVQAKLKETVNKGKMTSFDRIANMLDTGGDGDEMTEVVEQEYAPPTGINKAPIHSTRRSAKRKLKARQAKEVVVEVRKKKKEKPKPRYFCQF